MRAGAFPKFPGCPEFGNFGSFPFPVFSRSPYKGDGKRDGNGKSGASEEAAW